MQIVVNGDNRDVPENLPLIELLLSLDLKPQMTIVERNGRILDPMTYAEVYLCKDDVLELVRFVGGG